MKKNYCRFYTGVANNMDPWRAEVRQGDIRTEQELIAAEKEFFDKVWYTRHLNAKDGKVSTDPTICKDAECAAQRIQGQYGDVQEWFPQNNYELGYIQGTLAAVRWVLGAEWGDLDT